MNISSFVRAIMIAFIGFVSVGCANFDLTRSIRSQLGMQQDTHVVSAHASSYGTSDYVVRTPLAYHHKYRWLSNNPIPASALPKLPAEYDRYERFGRYESGESLNASSYSDIVVVDGYPYLESRVSISTNSYVQINERDYRAPFVQSWTPDPNGPRAGTVSRRMFGK